MKSRAVVGNRSCNTLLQNEKHMKEKMKEMKIEEVGISLILFHDT